MSRDFACGSPAQRRWAAAATGRQERRKRHLGYTCTWWHEHLGHNPLAAHSRCAPGGPSRATRRAVLFPSCQTWRALFISTIPSTACRVGSRSCSEGPVAGRFNSKAQLVARCAPPDSQDPTGALITSNPSVLPQRMRRVPLSIARARFSTRSMTMSPSSPPPPEKRKAASAPASPPSVKRTLQSGTTSERALSARRRDARARLTGWRPRGRERRRQLLHARVAEAQGPHGLVAARAERRRARDAARRALRPRQARARRGPGPAKDCRL